MNNENISKVSFTSGESGFFIGESHLDELNQILNEYEDEFSPGNDSLCHILISQLNL